MHWVSNDFDLAAQKAYQVEIGEPELQAASGWNIFASMVPKLITL